MTSIDAGREMAARGGDVGGHVQLRHLTIGELEHELANVEGQRLFQHRSVHTLRERPAEEVAEAEVDGEIDAIPDPGDGIVEEGRELIRRFGMDGGGGLIELDVVGAGVSQRPNSAARMGTNARAAAMRSG